MYASLRRQYLAMMSTRPSCWVVACWIYDCRYASKFFDGGKVTSNTQSNCQPLKMLSLRTDVNRAHIVTCRRYPRVGVAIELLHHLAVDLVAQLPMAQTNTKQPTLLLQ